MAVILVVEDDPAIRRFVEMVLEGAGHQTLSASNGLEAVALFRSYQDRISVVISDLTMPVMSGQDAIRRMRESRPNTKIICTTGYSDLDLPERVTLIKKPFTPTALLDCIRRILEGTQKGT